MGAAAPSTEACAWWLRNHVCMPFDWERVMELYEQSKQKGTDK